jgi:hypothetical protein
MKNNKTIQTYSLSPKVIKKIKEMADYEARSASWIANDLLEKALKEAEKAA